MWKRRKIYIENNTNNIKYCQLFKHGGFLGRVFQKERNKKTNDGVFLGILGTFQNGILENILYGAFWEMAHSDHFFKIFTVNWPFSTEFFTYNTNFWPIVTENKPKHNLKEIPSLTMGQKFNFWPKIFSLQNDVFCYF